MASPGGMPLFGDGTIIRAIGISGVAGDQDEQCAKAASAQSEAVRCYETASHAFATCRYLETVGRARPRREFDRLLALHDRRTCCDSILPLA
jgi:hypothetical protein